MAKTKAEKAAVIEKLADGIKNAASTTFVHFSKLSVADETAMRRALKEGSVKYVVAKKTLIRRALESLGHKHDELPLEGEVAVAFGGGDDATASARLVHEFGKKLTDKLAILGGIFENRLLGAAQMQAIATIPSLDALRGMFAQVINSPRSRFAIVLSEVAKKKSA